MNPRRIRARMRLRFPTFDAARLDWVNTLGRDGMVNERLLQLIDENISALTLLVEVHRKLGDAVSRADLAPYIGSHIGQGEIHIADLDFTEFMVIAVSGVATTWRQNSNRPPPEAVG